MSGADPRVSNSVFANNPDIDVRGTATADGKVLQHVRLDVGTGSSESQVDSSNPLPVSLTPSASSLVIETVTGTLGALNAEVVVDNPRFCLVELWGTASVTVSFYKMLDTPTGTAETAAFGTKAGTTGSLFQDSGGLSFSATNGEAWGQFSVVAAQRFKVKASGYTSGTLNVRITNMNWPVDANTMGRLYQIGTTLASFPQIDFDTSQYGFEALHWDIDLFTQRMAQLTSGAPAGTEVGLITRNIPSGVQAASQSGTWNVRLHDPAGSALPKVDGVSSSGAYGVPAMVWDPDSVAWTPLIGSGTGLYVVQQGAINVSEIGVSTTATLSNVSASASSVTLLASNSGRKKAHFYNDSSYPCYLKHGSSASTTSFTVLMQPQSYYTIEPPCYSGLVAGIWGTASGTMRVTEETA